MQIDGGTQEHSQDAVQPVSASALVTAHGTVRNAVTGAPLARVLVRVEGDADSGTLTDGEGRFEIPGVPAGPQIVRLVKPGFRDRPYATEDASLQADGPAHSVLLAADMPRLEFNLTPNCALQGHIELSTGDPAQGINVVLLKQVTRSGRASWAQVGAAKTNGDGAYRFAGLPDGTYAVYTQPALDSEPAVSTVAAGRGANVARAGYPAVFYPDAREFSGAGRIHLSAGQQGTANFNLALEPFQTVTAIGLLQGGSTGTAAAPPKPYTAVVMDTSGHLLPYTAQYDETNHEIQAFLPDGTYTLLLRGLRDPQFVGDTIPYSAREGRRAGAFAGLIDLTVAGHPVTGLRVPLGTPQMNAIQLRYLLSGASPPTNSDKTQPGDAMNLLVDQADGLPHGDGGAGGVWTTDVGPDRIEFTVGQPGLYWLGAYIPKKDQCAGPFIAGGVDLAREPLPLSPSATTPSMELTLRDDCAQLSLSLPLALSEFLPGEEPFYTVYVVPDFDTIQDIPPMTMHPSSGPTLKLDGLTPGSYHVYTFLTPVHLEYRNPAAIAALRNPGQAVTLSPGATSNLVLEAPGS